MKIQSWLLAGLLAPIGAVAFAQDKPPAAAPANSPQAAMAKKAEALTEEQIKQSHDLPALTKLAQLYNSQQDLQRFGLVLERVVEPRAQLRRPEAVAGDGSRQGRRQDPRLRHP